MPTPTPSPPPGPDREPELEPQDVAAWIDAHDLPELAALDDLDPTDALAEQRAEHEPDRSDVTELNPALGRLVNNTGDDGGAASG